MRHWFKDQHLRSLLKNTSYLAVSKGVAAVGGLVTLAFAGRSLGVVAFGLLILVHSYAQAASGLTKFNSWQVVVRYGGPALRAGDEARFRRAIGFALGLDLASGILTMIAAMLLLPLVAPLFKLPEELIVPATAYCLLLPLMGAGAASGVLRLFDRFDLLGWQGTITPNVRAVLTVVAWWQQWPLLTFILIWFVTDLIGDLVMWWMAWRELKRRGKLSGIRPTLKAGPLERGWPFAISINLNSSLNTAWGPLARLLVGAVLSPAAAGLYRVASSIADAAQKPTDFLNKAFYPEVMRLDHRDKAPWQLMARTMILSALLGAVALLMILIGGEWLLRVAFGPEFVAAHGVMLVLLGVPLLMTVTFPLPAMLHAVGRVNLPLIANLIGALAYVALIFPLADRFGLIGAGAAFLAGRAVMMSVMALAVARERRRLTRA
ncbi:lipopolysaccharide biosynthesis protein [Sphingomonas mesophila]|uniref:lipopolysaccharide biosynthesis protein n=1 Tax=Sphingomonas mesophila TaxID=2303576 RepID=UPI000E5698B7|nr:oligosaccharide flippase family protein [Sphingomonas mesophila]